MSYTGRARQASQEEDGPGEAARLRPPARLREVPADVHGLHLSAVLSLRVLLLPLLGCEKKKRSRRPGVRPAKGAVDASMSAQEEHAKAKKNRERRAKAEAEAKAAAEKDAEAVLADQPDLAEPLGNNATT